MGMVLPGPAAVLPARLPLAPWYTSYEPTRSIIPTLVLTLFQYLGNHASSDIAVLACAYLHSSTSTDTGVCANGLLHT
eukprot:3941254-Rhodomonas_salina.2